MTVDKMKISDFIPIVGLLRYEEKLDQQGLSREDFDKIINRCYGLQIYNIFLFIASPVTAYLALKGLEKLLN